MCPEARVGLMYVASLFDWCVSQHGYTGSIEDPRGMFQKSLGSARKSMNLAFPPPPVFLSIFL